MRTIVSAFLLLLVNIGTAECQNIVYFQITSTNSVHFIVTDPFGRRTGSDPRGAENRLLGIDIDEIPKATYSFEGPGDNPDSTKPQERVTYHVFMYLFESPQNDGVYSIRVIGISTSNFKLHVSISPNEILNGRKFRYVLGGAPIEADSVINYNLEYRSSLAGEITLKKEVSSRSLLQDISAMRQLVWIKNQPTADKYVNLISSFGTQFQQKDYVAARTTLGAILQTLPTDSLTSLTTDACKLLREDTQQLLNELPPAVTSLNPAFALAASGGFSLKVNGLPFTSSDSVSWNGSSRPTTFISSTELHASIPTGDVTKVGSFEVSVRTQDGRVSNNLSFHVISAVNWVDTLISYKHKAFDLGWIQDKGIANSLDQKLDNAKAQLVRKNNKSAKNILEAFVSEVEAQKNKHLTSEAYALLKFNAEYLISKLQ